MSYKDEINKLLSTVNKNIVNIDAKREKTNPPTQANSEFLINKEQGDWAEHTLMKAINEQSKKYCAVKYGLGDDRVAGESGFKEYYEKYQTELDTIGKRPDLLIFDRNDIDSTITDISNEPLNILDELVPKAKCGIEVRSSAFLIEKYDMYMAEKISKLTTNAFKTRDLIINNYSELLIKKDEALYKIIKDIDNSNIHAINFKVRSWKSTQQLEQLSALIKELKGYIKEIQKREFLSVTPKTEDIRVVYNWIQRYDVPHYYVQVFFDKAYGISYKKIIELLNDESLEGVTYFIEGDVKNQNKITIKIRANYGNVVLSKVSLPEHYSSMKELERGRLLFYVKFKDSVAAVSGKDLNNLVGFDLI